MAQPNFTASLPLPHDDFDAGFRVGWEAVVGNTTPLPRVPLVLPRLVMLGYSKFTMGVRSGIEAAMKVEDLDQLLSGLPS